MFNNLRQIQKQASSQIQKSDKLVQLADVEKKYLGRKGELTKILRSLKELPFKSRREIGSMANELRVLLKEEFAKRKSELVVRTRKIFDFDQTEPGLDFPVGHRHPLTRIRQEIEDFFRGYGFAVLEGPEIETDYYNFEALNMPADHPARDIWDTFYIRKSEVGSQRSEKLLLRTHTSPMQVRVMEKQTPPIAVIVPGRTFRHEATDARHEHTFDQVEGFYVDSRVSSSHLKYILHNLFRYLFGDLVKIKLRPSYFPFTEPSFELVMSCPFCREKGCSICGNGWLEMAGSGMIHPKVFEYAGYKPRQWRGFAFGLGITRVAMLKYNIPDIRMFYQNDLRILRQF